MAVTATATSKVEEDIKTHLLLQNPRVTKAGVDRANLWFGVNLKCQEGMKSDLEKILAPDTSEEAEKGIHCLDFNRTKPRNFR